MPANKKFGRKRSRSSDNPKECVEDSLPSCGPTRVEGSLKQLTGGSSYDCQLTHLTTTDRSFLQSVGGRIRWLTGALGALIKLPNLLSQELGTVPKLIVQDIDGTIFALTPPSSGNWKVVAREGRFGVVPDDGSGGGGEFPNYEEGCCAEMDDGFWLLAERVDNEGNVIRKKFHHTCVKNQVDLDAFCCLDYDTDILLEG